MNIKKENVLTIVGIITLLVFVGGATFAYFVAQGGSSEQTNINVTTHTTDSLVFEVGKAISVTADQTSFAPGAGNQADSTFARATLKANSSTNSAIDHYYVYLSIDTNEFKYTTDTKTAELILTVNYKDNEGNITPITTINDLNYVTLGSVSGFDITEANNLITIANNHEITSTGIEVDEWDITLTLVNLNSNQTSNAGKTFNATLMIQKEESFAGHIIAQYTTQGANNLYYHNGTILDDASNILDAEDRSYRYAGGDYTIAPQYQDTYKRISKQATTDTDALISFICGTAERLPHLACEEETKYFYLTYENVETKTQYVTYKEALAKTVEDGYILETPVKNYVCFGSNEGTCPQDNLYRIIGVFNGKAKLIKADYATKELLGTNGEAFISDTTEVNNLTSNYYRGNIEGEIDKYYWNKINKDLALEETGHAGVWSYSELNKTNLNTNYVNKIGEEWADKIDETLWFVPNDFGRLGTYSAKSAYSREQGINRLTTLDPFKAKIGLMYLSEYLYGVNSKNWSKKEQLMSNTPPYMKIRDDNWLYLGSSEWTLVSTNKMNNIYYAIIISSRGSAAANSIAGSNAVRPTFYLKSTVTFAGGSGTSANPYRIA